MGRLREVAPVVQNELAQTSALPHCATCASYLSPKGERDITSAVSRRFWNWRKKLWLPFADQHRCRV